MVGGGGRNINSGGVDGCMFPCLPGIVLQVNIFPESC